MRWLRRGIVVLVVVFVVAVAGIWLALHGSLAQLDGTRAVAGLREPAIVQRDAQGSVTIDASSRNDLAFALGFVHAQERYFQMDLLRRVAAGELAELVGPAALPLDRRHRLHRFRARGAEVFAAAPLDQRTLVDAYRDGVNEGLDALNTRPWEYLLLGEHPKPWRSEDTALVIYAMYLDLQGDGENARELNLGRLHAALPPALVDFLVAPGSEWDAPMRGDAFAAGPVPPADVFDLRTQPRRKDAIAAPHVLLDAVDLGLRPGSNNFAVGGALTANGAALVADDMHLGLRVPNIWLRARLRYPDPRREGETIDLNGVTLPGTPALIAGSNGHVAWGYTNSYGDWSDWIRVVREGDDSYRFPGGVEPIRHHRETIRVHGGPDDLLQVDETRWGPIMATDTDGTPLALAWTAHDPHAMNLDMLLLEHARTVGEVLDLGPTIGMPAQNLIVGDSAGNIGWVLTGNAMPKRQDFDPSRPADFSRGPAMWAGWVEHAAYPRIENPPDHRLWSANARTIDGAELALVGDGGYDLGARSRQIRDELRARDRFTPDAMLSIQLDDRAVFLQRWHALLVDTLARHGDRGLSTLQQLTSTWTGRASPESVDYRLVRAFRQYTIEAVLAPFAAIARERHPDFAMPSAQGYEAPVWKLLQERPEHLRDPSHASWDELLVASAQRVAAELGAKPGGLTARRWGEHNRAAIRHPLSAALPGVLARTLDMPRDELPGDHNMPRVQTAGFGASERFAISPGREAESYLMMPGGQSGHPLSPFHGVGHADWVHGRATPLLPGESAYSLTLQPTL